MTELKVSKSFFEAMAVLASGGKVRNKNWSENALYVSLEPLLNYPIAVFHKKIAEVNKQPVIERIGWSPSLADLTGEWEIIEEAKEPIEDTFGYGVLQLFEKDWLDLKHKNWSGNKFLRLDKHKVKTLQEFPENPEEYIKEEEYCTLTLYDIDNDRSYEYLPTMPDILRKGWIIIDD